MLIKWLSSMGSFRALNHGHLRTQRAALEEAVTRGVRRAFRRETGKRPAVLPMVVLI